MVQIQEKRFGAPNSPFSAGGFERTGPVSVAVINPSNKTFE
jgi:hypothetical protein